LRERGEMRGEGRASGRRCGQVTVKAYEMERG